MAHIEVIMTVAVGELKYQLVTEAFPTTNALRAARIHAEKTANAMRRLLVDDYIEDDDDDGEDMD